MGRYTAAQSLVLILFFTCDVNCAQDKHFYCQACKAIVNEIEFNVSKIDPKKTINVESFRVDPNGKTRTIQWLRTSSKFKEQEFEEIHRNIGLLETLSSVKRMVTHEGMPAADSTEDDSLRDAAKEDTSNNLSGKIKLACDAIVDDFEDEILYHFKSGHQDGVQKICVEVCEYCPNEVKDEL